MSGHMVKYEALVVDPDIERRMRLKGATTSVVQFKKVFLVNSLDDANTRMSGEDHFDIVFLNYSLQQGEISQFVKNSKEKKAGMDAAYILVMASQDQDSSTIASNVMIGADGFLFEPYSVDQLVEITNLAAKVKAERSANREKAALGFLMNDIIKQIDMICYLKSAGYDVGRGFKKFRKLCDIFQTLEGNSKDVYYDVVHDKFENAPLPAKLEQNYKGASKRVKEKMEKKMLAEIEQGLDDDDDDDSAGDSPATTSTTNP